MQAETARLHGLQAAAERIASSLVELELDPSRKLVEASALAGESARRWAAANAMLTELWRRRGLLEELLQRAEAAQRGKRVEELRSLLTGPSIELAQTEVPLAERSLQGDAQSVERCSAIELIASMSSAFEEVTLVISAIASAWQTLVPELEAARKVLGGCTALAEEVGEESHAGLTAAGRLVERLSSAVSTDPLSVAPAEIDGMLESLRGFQKELEESAALKRNFDARIAEARELLERVRGAAREANAAHQETCLKIVQPDVRPDVPPGPPAPRGTEDELDRIGELARRGAWKEAGMALARWTSGTRALLEDFARALAASRAPIEARDQFRALLEAYQVKAKRLGLLEEPRIAEIFARAHEALYHAPTDLALAERLVRSYRESLTGGLPRSEVQR